MYQCVVCQTVNLASSSSVMQRYLVKAGGYRGLDLYLESKESDQNPGCRMALNRCRANLALGSDGLLITEAGRGVQGTKWSRAAISKELAKCYLSANIILGSFSYSSSCGQAPALTQAGSYRFLI